MKKRSTLALSALLMFGITTAATSCSFLGNIVGQVFEEFGITLNYKNKNLVVGQSFQLKLKVSYDDGDVIEKAIDDSYTISSSNTNVATVDETGKVTAVGAGSCTINVSSGQFLNMKCTIKVEEKVLQSIEINRMTTQYPLGQAFAFNGVVTALYQFDYKESITPNVDSSAVNVNVRGTYPIVISYQTKSLTRNIEILPAEEIKSSVISMDHNIDEQELNDYPFEVTALPVEGSPKMLILPIKFTDSDVYISNYVNVKSDLNDAFFGNESSIGQNSICSGESVKTYYEKESRGKLHISGTVADWYIDSYPSTQYYNGGTEERTIMGLANAAADYYFEHNPSENRHDYDYDDDGFLDGVVCVFGAPTYANLGRKSDEMWAMVRAHSGQLPNKTTPAVGKYMWVSYTLMYPNESTALSRTGRTEYCQTGHINASFIKLDTHTYIHETAHMIGIDDYYSYTSRDTYASDASMQTNTILTHDPYSLLLFNWVDAVVPERTETISIDDLQSGGNVIILSPNWNLDNSPFDEYIVLDLFTPTGLNKLDSSFAGYDTSRFDNPGIRAWHVDSRMKEILGYDSSARKYLVGDFVTDPSAGHCNVITDNSPNSYADEFEEYDQFAQLFLLRNDGVTTFSTTKAFDKNTMFYEGDTFTMEAFKDQFSIPGKLDSGLDLGWSFTVDSIYNQGGDKWGATITVTKL